MKLFLLFIFISAFLNAQANNQPSDNCDDCSPLAEVAVTNAGLEKLVALSLDENLRSLSAEVHNRAGFRELKIDKSHCKTQTVKEAWKSKKTKDSCYGLPNFDDSGGIGADTLLRPYTAEIKNFKLNKVDLSLAAPVKCHQFVCDFEIKANAIDISGELNVNYSDKQETFIPPTLITLKSTKGADIRMSGQALIEPRTGQVNDLVFVNEKKTKIKIAPASLTLDMAINSKYASKEEEIKLKAKNFHRYVPVGKISPKYVDEQYNRMHFHLVIDSGREIAKKRKDAGQPELSWQAERALAEKEVDQMIKDKYGSVAQFKQKLNNINWPSANDAQGTYEFMQNPPAELVVFSDITEKMDFANIAAVGENSGFTNAHAFMFTLAAVELGKRAAQTEFFVNEVIQDRVEKEVLPAVHAQVNSELRNLKQYWNQISKIPTLNAQNLQVLDDLKDKLRNSQNPEARSLLEQKIEALNKKIDADWIAIDTEVAIDRNTRDGKLLRAQIAKSNPACSTYPKKFSEDNDDDFDMRTQFGVNTLQEYFARMAQNKVLNLCVNSTDPATCNDGTKINLKNAPKIGCENGEFTFEVDAEFASKILGIGVNADVNAKVKAKINNCSGSPCIQFTDSNGRFKNVFMNTFFGTMLDRGLSTALVNTNNVPVNVPHAKMKKPPNSDKDCSTKLDWSLEP